MSVEKVTNDFTTQAMGGNLQGIINDLSFPSAQPGGMLVRRSGPVCKTCLLPADQHATPEAQTGFSPLTGVPGVHPSVDDGSTKNYSTRLAEFSQGSGR